MAWPAILAAIAGDIIGAGAEYFANRERIGAADRAADRSERIGREGAGMIDESSRQAQASLMTAGRTAGSYLEQGREDLRAQQAANQQQFNPATTAGNMALDKLRALIVGGPESQQAALAQDPGYQVRLEEGEKALERAQRASGGFGGGAHTKDLLRFSQGLASQEVDRATARLMGLAGMGQQALQTQQTLNTTLSGQLASQSQALGQNAFNVGSGLSQLQAASGLAQANAISGAQNQALGFELQSGLGQAREIENLGDAARDISALIAAIDEGGYRESGAGGNQNTPV